MNAKAWEKAEDPIYVLENNMPIDTAWCDLPRPPAIIFHDHARSGVIWRHLAPCPAISRHITRSRAISRRYLEHQLAEPIKRLYEPVPRLLAEIISRDRAEIEPR